MINYKQIQGGSWVAENCPCFCPSCGKDFIANVQYDEYGNPLSVPAAIICGDCQNSPLAQSIRKILNEY